METPDSSSADAAVQQRITEVSKQIEREQQMWAERDMHPGMMQVDLYMLLIKLRVVLRVLEEKFSMTEDDVLLYLREETLKQLQADRKIITEARAASLVVAQTQLLGPDGNPLVN